MRSCLAVVIVCGCGFTGKGKLGGDGGIDPHVDANGDGVVLIDMPIDAPADALDCTTWTPHHFDPCGIPPKGTGPTLTGGGSPYVYDTTTGGGTLVDKSGTVLTIAAADITQPGGTHAAVWSVDVLTVPVGVEIRVIGGKPLIVASWSTITVAGTIDAGSYRAVRTGAGANPADCAAHNATKGGDGASGTSGGGGGGFQGKGGTGGEGDGNGAHIPGGAGGASVARPSDVIGGCPGASSGANGASSSHGGDGGGAVELTARASITVSGTLLAGGGGGFGTANGLACGGGAGGSGGEIGLEAPSIDVSGSTIAANGGGGGGGADLSHIGGNGGDGTADAMQAAAGMSGGGGEAGAKGGAGAKLDGDTVIDPGTVPPGGGGGGGGSVGFILYYAPTLSSSGATLSPAVQTGP